MNFIPKMRDYYLLTKPRILLLGGFTGLVGLIAEGSLLQKPWQMLILMFAMVLAGGSANALNQYFDRDIDAIMPRTREKRPIPSGRMNPRAALIFSLIIGVISIFLLYVYGNLLTAGLGLFTILFYVFIYTLWLKRKTPYNIVIGGAAGATPPLMGWAAAHGEISWVALLMFALIFVWTPAHFWALALCLKEEYAQVSVPMLPVTDGVEKTRKQIFFYSVLTIITSLLLGLWSGFDKIYLLPAIMLGMAFIWYALKVLREKTEKSAWKMFGFSIVYLFLLFSFMIVDVLVAAEPIPRELQNVGIEEKFGQSVDLNLRFKNEKGEEVPLRTVIDGKRPVLLLLAYYRCPNLCNLFLNGTLETLKKLDWTPGKNFQILTVSIDTEEEFPVAQKKKENYLKDYNRPDAGPYWHFWVNDRKIPSRDPLLPSNALTLSEQVGFKYRYDPDQQQYAHSSAMIVLTPEGKVSRYLYGVQFEPQDVRLALTEAGGRRIGSLVDHILLFCYHYDPQTKKYALYATNLMRAAGGLTVFILALVLIRVSRRRNFNKNRFPS